MKRQKVFYDISQEHPAEIYRLEEYSAFVIRKDSEGVFLLYGNIHARSIIISEMLIGVPEINI